MIRFLKLFACAALMMIVPTISPSFAATVVVAKCDSVTDGDAQGCLFKGNINEQANPLNENGFKNAELAYNALMNPDITLNWIAKTDDANFASFGTFSGLGKTSGTFLLPGWNLDYFAVKAGPQFWLYEFNGTNNWSIPGKNGMSHIAFFGTKSVSAVPEPATWAMMLVGFGLIGAALRRVKRDAVGVALRT